jgi:hypothetical protein
VSSLATTSAEEIRPETPSTSLPADPVQPPADPIVPPADPVPPAAEETPPVPDPAQPPEPVTPSMPTNSSINHAVIAEVRITGGSGKTDNDFIKIYNPTSSQIDISGWKLRRRTQSGTEYSIKVMPAGSIIMPAGYFAWANSGNGFSDSVGANISSTQTLTDNNSIALTDASSNIIDALAWGSGQTNPFIEGQSYPTNPPALQSLKRKIDNGTMIDSGDNSSDFYI